jgi:hypothetical protein
LFLTFSTNLANDQTDPIFPPGFSAVLKPPQLISHHFNSSSGKSDTSPLGRKTIVFVSRSERNTPTPPQPQSLRELGPKPLFSETSQVAKNFLKF